MFVLMFLVVAFCVAVLLNEVGVRGVYAILIGMLVGAVATWYTALALTGLPLTKVL